MTNENKENNVDEEEVLIEDELDEEISDKSEEEDMNVESNNTLEDITKELEEKNNMYLRLQADFTNYKKRNEKERSGLVTLGMETIVTDILPVLDNFERAMDSAKENKDDKFYQGVEMIQKQLIEVLEKNGLEEINAMHEKFDPEYHYAVQTQESDMYQSDVVLNIMQKGYKLKDRVIRPAMVIVSE